MEARPTAKTILQGAWIAGVVAVGIGARAQPRTEPRPAAIELVYEAPEACPAQADVLRATHALLGGDREAGSPLHAKAKVVSGTDGRFHLDLELERDGSTSRRTLDSQSCQTLADTTALLIALSYDPEAVERSQASAPPAPSPPVEPPAPPDPFPAPKPPPVVASEATPALAPFVLAPPPSKPERRATIWGFRARLGPSFGVADMPDPHPGVTGAVALRIDAYAVEAAFELGIGSTGTLDQRPDAGADFTLMTGILRGCRVLAPFWPRYPRRPGAPELEGCAGIELGSLAGEGFGVQDPQRGEALWVAPRIDARLGIGVVGPLSFGLEVGAAFPVDRRRFVITGGDATLVVHEPGPVAGRLGLAAELEL